MDMHAVPPTPPPSAPEPAGPSSEAEPRPLEAPTQAMPKPPSRLGLFLRRALRWTVAVLVVFVLGIGATWIAQVRPKAQEITQLRADLQAAQEELDRLRPLEAENQQLQAEADLARQRLAVLGSLVDVTSAQVAMLVGDPGTARSELADTGARLTGLGNLLEPASASEVGAMQTRLEQVLAELDDDAFAAQRDLEVLANALATLDRSLASD
jgi:hypothetical protein